MVDAATLWQSIAGILGALFLVLAVMFSRWMTKQEENDAQITKKLDELAVHPQTCIRTFADKADNAESHNRLWHQVNAQAETLTDHETRIKVLEKTR